MAFDLVGPFLRSRDSFKYILIAISLVSRYPEAISLKDITAESVVEGLVDIYNIAVLESLDQF